MIMKLLRQFIESWGYIVAAILILLGITIILVNVHNISTHKDAQVDALIKQAGESEKNQQIFRAKTDQQIQDLTNTINQQHAGIETLIEQLNKLGVNPIVNFDGTIKPDQATTSNEPIPSSQSSNTPTTSTPTTSPPSTPPTTVVQSPPQSPPITTPPTTPPPVVTIPQQICLPLMPCITTNQKGLIHNGSLSQRYF